MVHNEPGQRDNPETRVGSEVTLAGSRFKKGMDMTDTPLRIATRSLEHRARVVEGLDKPGPGQIRAWPYPESSYILIVFQDYVDLREAVSEALIDLEVKRPLRAAGRLTDALKKGDPR